LNAFTLYAPLEHIRGSAVNRITEFEEFPAWQFKYAAPSV
jgi:hypothetical protein